MGNACIIKRVDDNLNLNEIVKLIENDKTNIDLTKIPFSNGVASKTIDELKQEIVLGEALISKINGSYFRLCYVLNVLPKNYEKKYLINTHQVKTKKYDNIAKVIKKRFILAEKTNKNEDPIQGAKRAVKEELGSMFTEDQFSKFEVKDIVNVERKSVSYPDFRCIYQVIYCTCLLEMFINKEMFITQEVKQDSVICHYWRWVDKNEFLARSASEAISRETLHKIL